MIPEKTIERLSVYRRLIEEMLKKSKKTAYSYQLAELAGVSSSQVRRDFMFIGSNGRSNSGYDLMDLSAAIEQYISAQEPDNIALVGAGNLGRAVLTFFNGRRPNLVIKACFDTADEKIGRLINGCRCYSIDEIPDVVKCEKIHIAVMAVPEVAAQGIADMLIKAGVNGILNFAPVPLTVPPGIFVENVDLTMYMEKVSHYSRNYRKTMEL